jgi:hypothetical protein
MFEDIEAGDALKYHTCPTANSFPDRSAAEGGRFP